MTGLAARSLLRDLVMMLRTGLHPDARPVGRALLARLPKMIAAVEAEPPDRAAPAEDARR